LTKSHEFIFCRWNIHFAATLAVPLFMRVTEHALFAADRPRHNERCFVNLAAEEIKKVLYACFEKK